MRALIRKDDRKTLTLDVDHPEPHPAESAGYYLIRSKASALTRQELSWPEPLIPEYPVPGFDLAGVIISIPNAHGEYQFHPGDEIYALTAFDRQGNTRELTLAHESELAPKPKNLAWEEAASVPLSALSAYQALFVHGDLRMPGRGSDSSKRVLVTAASGGVGIWGVQMARIADATVIATCGTANVDFVRALGANTVLDYTKTDLLDWVSVDRDSRGFDIVLDCIGGPTLSAAWKCVRTGGKIISVGEPPDAKKPDQGVASEVKGVWFIVKPDGTQLSEISQWLEQGICKPAVDSVYKMEQYNEAFERLEGGHAKGKVVIHMDG